MKIGSKEWEENSEDVQKRSYEPKGDGYKKLLTKRKEKNWFILEISTISDK